MNVSLSPMASSIIFLKASGALPWYPQCVGNVLPIVICTLFVPLLKLSGINLVYLSSEPFAFERIEQFSEEGL